MLEAFEHAHLADVLSDLSNLSLLRVEGAAQPGSFFPPAVAGESGRVKGGL